MLRIAAVIVLAAFVAALAFAGCGGNKEAANAAEAVRGEPAATAAPYEPAADTVAEGPAATAAPYEAPAEPAGQKLLETRCTVCHTLERVKEEKLDAAGWEKTVERMKKKGAIVNDEEREALVEYLTATYGQ
jgi:cytochrome c5